MLVPMTPPPTTTTSARAGRPGATRSGNHAGSPTRCPDMELTCLKCHGPMRSYERNGIVIDQCAECRGVFLDRGELEKLIDAESREAATAPAAPAWAHRSHARAAVRRPAVADEYRHDYPDDHRYDDPRYRRKKKKSFLEDLFDSSSARGDLTPRVVLSDDPAIGPSATCRRPRARSPR